MLEMRGDARVRERGVAVWDRRSHVSIPRLSLPFGKFEILYLDEEASDATQCEKSKHVLGALTEC